MPKAWHANVRFGSKADTGAGLGNVRFTPKSRHWLSALGCPLCARSGHYATQQKWSLIRSPRRRGRAVWEGFLGREFWQS